MQLVTIVLERLIPRGGGEMIKCKLYFTDQPRIGFKMSRASKDLVELKKTKTNAERRRVVGKGTIAVGRLKNTT